MSLVGAFLIKIIDSCFRYKAGLKEVQILQKLRQGDPEDKKHLVKLERTFEHRGHLCLVFESLRCVHIMAVWTYLTDPQYESP